MSNVAQAAQGRWYGILKILGIDEMFLVNRHGPCPMCDGKDRYRWDDKDGKGTYYCNTCGPGDGLKLLMEYNGWDFAKTATEVEKIVGESEMIKPKPKRNNKPALERIANEATKPLHDDPVTLYIRSRGLVEMPPEIRYHPSMAYYDGGIMTGRHPAMLAIVRDCAGVALTYHVTYLTDDGHKADVPSVKKVMPPISTISGGAIRLFGKGNHICVTEGIETAIAVYEEYKLPVWAAVNAGGMAKLILPDNIKRVTIFADNDATFTGQKAAYILANRLKVRCGIEVDVVVPDVVGFDYLDMRGR